MAVVAAIDLGTVTQRLAVARVEHGCIDLLEKQSTIVNVGEGVDTNHRFSDEAMKRAVSCVESYITRIKDFAVEGICCTMTSAARDAKNADVLIRSYKALGLKPQIIEGKTEGSLTFLGVAQDFHDERIMVADNGGGSTELALGELSEGVLALEWVYSADVGCRRLTERFLSKEDPPSLSDVCGARSFAADEFARALEMGLVAKNLPSTLVVTGGTATTLIALEKKLVPYDSSQVHLAELGKERLDELTSTLAQITQAERAQLKGIQTKRAPVILGGCVALQGLMDATGAQKMVVSESDLLAGLLLVCAAHVDKLAQPLVWDPIISLF